MNLAEENALRIRISKLEEENVRMRKMATTKGFYDAYFKALQFERTNTDAFNKINDEYFDLFGIYRYSSYDVFRNSTKNLLRK